MHSSIAAAAHNLSRILRKMFGIGKPKRLQGGYADAEFLALTQLVAKVVRRWTTAITRLQRRTLEVAAGWSRSVVG